ncbi:MAG: M23 family metallopeptidase [Sandarakinorhabdus sp.]|nr:M23 family metallopeptidase [Sandarakinorhabdus sp.]
MASRPFFALITALALAGCVAPDRRVPTPPAVAGAVPPKPAWTARKVVPDAITVPGGRLHTVKPGETGIAIARAYGAEWRKVAAANGLKPPFTLEVGDKLLLPSAKQVASMSVEERARAFTLQIDDIITGGEPAAPVTGPPPRKTGMAKPAAPPPVAPLPMLSGDAPRFAWPVDGRIISGFGAKPGGRFNDGVNLKASAGSPVRAAGDGVVAYAGDAIPGFGNLLLIKHAGGWVSAYGHNEALLVARGKRISRGEVIARAGATGSVNEPQVHFELRKGRTPVDPAKVIGGR